MLSALVEHVLSLWHLIFPPAQTQPIESTYTQ